jgi:hypothetical protein
VADDIKNGDTHEGTVISFTANKLVMKSTDGKEHTHTLTDRTRLMIDDKKVDAAAFRDLKAGTRIRVTTKKGDPTAVLRVEALEKNKDFGK